MKPYRLWVTVTTFFPSVPSPRCAKDRDTEQEGGGNAEAAGDKSRRVEKAAGGA